jgi:hypothetical protein
MPHFKCLGCKTRLYSAAPRVDLVEDLCPRCGAPLEPVGRLTEIMGFQSMAREPERLAEAIARTAPDETP